jgi:segregation and condensation protein A
LKEKASFTDMLLECENKIHAIYSFLAVLELLQEQIIRITLGEGFNNFWLTEAVAA